MKIKGTKVNVGGKINGMKKKGWSDKARKAALLKRKAMAGRASSQGYANGKRLEKSVHYKGKWVKSSEITPRMAKAMIKEGAARKAADKAFSKKTWTKKGAIKALQGDLSSMRKSRSWYAEQGMMKQYHSNVKGTLRTIKSVRSGTKTSHNYRKIVG